MIHIIAALPAFGSINLTLLYELQHFPGLDNDGYTLKTETM
ncbi:hypothetical protein J2W57_001892 [Chryseobacterium ginsenosidimutans]|uniref:Uncharacterized protein n=1 Tax=Chryseobacterium geocarposphaerae TaxID=1416776 RepID=A0ABU1LB65_9FLAO|nr:hypothetical protein [Chryseobacterium geocarposphaerae]MDR6698520.1 hypothetical protein [Chryseobacterium ginsenosidimutans]